MLRQRREVFSDADPHPFSYQRLLDRDQSVCFTGHRRLTPDEMHTAYNQLKQLLEKLYQQGFRSFLCGGALGFDTLAERAVVDLRQTHDDVRLVMCIPCPDQSHRWNSRQCTYYEQMLYLSDEIRVLSSFYYDGCMQIRNQYMVDHSSICVAYMKKTRHSGTISTMRYAMSQDVPIINIAVPGAVQEYLSQP